ncbi:MAG: hypothetical protein N2689_17440, partial [Verrucomicrobiae bacterium]|nr:hypothetical protein [Verrucomicrobiae bacterium]
RQAIVLTALNASYAQCGGGGCSISGAKADVSCPCGPCGAALDKMQLTDEQKEKLAILTADCSKVECPKAMRGKFCAGLKEILTPQQLNQVKAACKKAGVDCPMFSGGCKAGS